MSDFEELGQFDYTVHAEEVGDGLPRLWWHNGDRKAKTPGSFYTRSDDWVGDLPAPWKTDDRFDGETGWAAPVLRVLPITYRSQAFRRIETAGKVRREYVPKWEAGCSIHTELLCLVEGLEGAVVWSMKGMTGAAVTGKGGIFTAARQVLIAPAEKALKKKVPMHAFWLPIGMRLKDGKPEYVTLEQGAVITPPALRLPAGIEGRDLLNSLYAGRDVIEEAGALREEYEAWRQERRTAEHDEVAPPPVAAGRNTPQAVTDDELYGPFAPDQDDAVL